MPCGHGEFDPKPGAADLSAAAPDRQTAQQRGDDEPRRRLEACLALAAEWFWETDAELRYTWLSDKVEVVTARPVEWHIGQRLGDLVGLPADGEGTSLFLRALHSREPFSDILLRRETPNGVKLIRSRAQPMFDDRGQFSGYVGADLDVTERHRVEEALKESRALFEFLTENSPSAVALKDRDGRFVVANKKFREWYGFASRPIIGRTSFEVFPRHMAELYVDQDQEVFRLESLVEREMTIPFADGNPRQILVKKFPVYDGQANCTGVATIHVDVTEEKNREALLRQAQKMEAVGQLTGGVAHDFNNLLGIIQGNMDLLNRALAPEQHQLRALLEPALRAVERGASLTHRLLAFSRRQAMDVTSVDAGKLLRGIGAMLAPSLGEDIRLEVDIAPDAWPCLVDAGLLEQAIVNLANNARDAMASGGNLTLAIANHKIADADARQDDDLAAGDYVAISVTDTGEGMDGEVQRQIFEPFFTTKDVGKGSGLGLSMVYGFIKQSDGHVQVDSRVGAGTVVRLYVPRSTGAATVRDAAPGDFGEAVSGRTILVVEDDVDLRALVVIVLEGQGYRVLQAGSGMEALGRLKQAEQVDLLLTDMVLPGGMDGLEIAASARQRFPAMGLLFMSGYTDGRATRGQAELEGARLLRKPFDPTELVDQVSLALRSQ